MDKKVEFIQIQNDMHRKGLAMYKFSNCSTERRSLTISLITAAFPSFASRVEETVRPSPHQRKPFLSGNILIKVSVNNLLTILKQAYFFSLRYLLASSKQWLGSYLTGCGFRDLFAFVRTHPNLVFLWHQGRNFRAITGDCKLTVPINVISGISAGRETGLLLTRVTNADP